MANEKESFAVGDLVFAKMVGYPWWPGLIEEEKMLPEDIVLEKPSSSDEGLVLPIRFLGDKSYAWLSCTSLVKFTPDHPKALKKNFKSNRKSSRSLFMKGVYEATALLKETKNRPEKTDNLLEEGEGFESQRKGRLSIVSEDGLQEQAPEAKTEPKNASRELEESNPLKAEEELLTPCKSPVNFPANSSLKIEPMSDERPGAYTFRKYPKMTTKAAESEELITLRRAGKKRSLGISENGLSPEKPKRAKKPKVSERTSGMKENKIKNFQDFTVRKGKDYAMSSVSERGKPCSEVEMKRTFSYVNDSRMSNNQMAFAQELSEAAASCQPYAYTKGVQSLTSHAEFSPRYPDIVPPESLREDDVSSVDNGHVVGETSEISNNSEHRRFSTAAGVFMEEEVVALSVLVNLRN